MGRKRLPGTPPIDVEMRPSGRARRISLRVSGLDGRVTVTYPQGCPEPMAFGFAQEKEDWIRRSLTAMPAPQPVRVGALLPVLGEDLRIVPSSGRSAIVEDDKLVAPAQRTGPAVAALLKGIAQTRLSAAADRHARSLGREIGKFTLRDTRTRWGSCSSKGNLMFSWRLAMVPPRVLDYVAAHEVAHLRHMHHGPDFWETVRMLFGEYGSEREWLRREGSALHRYRFTD